MSRKTAGPIDIKTARFEELPGGRTKLISQAVFQSIADDPPVAGGCPILNTAIEADDAHPALRERARGAMNDWRATISRIVTRGIERQEIRQGVDADEVATLFICMLEGAVMLSNLYKDGTHMRRAVKHMTKYIETDLALQE